MVNPLPMVACSPEEDCGGAGRLLGVFSYAGAGVAGRTGSGVGVGVVDPVWVGFHIALKRISFSVLVDWGISKAGQDSLAPNNQISVHPICLVLAFLRPHAKILSATVRLYKYVVFILRRLPEMFESNLREPSSLPSILIALQPLFARLLRSAHHFCNRYRMEIARSRITELIIAPADRLFDGFRGVVCGSWMAYS